MKILVTGSKGVIGLKLVEELTNRGHHVFGIDLGHYDGEVGYVQNMGTNKWIYSRCDISEYRQLVRIFNLAGPFDLVYNCAAEFGRWNGEDYYEQLWKSNVIGFKNILKLQEDIGFKLIHFSSSEIYGDYSGTMSEGVTDIHVIKQMNDYAISKWVNELQINNSIEIFNTETVIVRLFNTYGAGEYYHPYRSVNCRFCYSALHKLPVIVYKKHYRSSTYIDDCIRTLANICDNFIPKRIYNIGSSQYHNIETLVDIIWKYTKADVGLITLMDSEKLTTRIKKVNIDLSIEELDHKETVSLEEGVKKTINWMKYYYKIK